jgi:stage V sporulation protein B
VIFFRNVLGTFITDGFIVVLNLLLGVLTARILGPERRGVLTLVMTLPVTLVYFADLGISQANVYFLGRNRRPESSIVANSVVVALIVGTVVGIALWSIRGAVLNTVLDDMPSHYLVAILLLVPLLLLYMYWMAILRARQQFGLFNVLRLLMPLALLGCTTLALLGLQGGIGWAVVAYLAGNLLAVGIGLFVVGRLVQFKPVFDWPLARESLAYGLKSYLQNLIGHLTYRLDVYLVALFLPPSEIAFYGIATSVAELSWYIPNAVGMVLFPKLSNELEERIHPLTAEACRHTLVITAVVTTAITLVGVIAIPLVYGADYRPATMPLIALGPGVVAMSLYKVLTRNFSSRDRQQISIVIAGLGLALNVTLDVLLIPQLGSTGAALASSCAYSAVGVAMLWAFRRDSQFSWREILRFERGDWLRYRDVGRYVLSRLHGKSSRLDGIVAPEE